MAHQCLSPGGEDEYPFFARKLRGRKVVRNRVCQTSINMPHCDLGQGGSARTVVVDLAGDASVLPDHIAPIPAPDSPGEAKLLVLLDLGLRPKIVPAEREKIQPDEG